MRNLLLPIFGLFAIGCGVLSYQKHAEAQLLQSRISDLEHQHAKLLQEFKAAQAAAARLADLEENNRRLTKERDDARARARQVADASPATGSSTGPAGQNRGGDMKAILQGFARQMDDPEFRKMMQSNQQRMITGAYESMFKKLGLSEEDTKLVTDLISSRNMAALDLGRKLMNGQSDEAAMAEVRKQIETTKAEYDTKLKGTLGEEKFKELSTFEQTVGDQRALDSVARNFERKNIPLEPTQKDALANIMREERLKLPNNEIPDLGGGPGMSVLLSETEAKARDQQEQTYQDTVLNRASQAGLSPDQVNALRDSFAERNQRRAMGRVMGRAFLGGSSR